MGGVWSSRTRPMGGGGGGAGGGGSDGAGASCELYVDKAVKVLLGGLQMILAIILVVLTHALDSPHSDTAYRVFSFLVLFQSVWLLLLLLLWYWLFGQDVTSHVQEILHHVNHLTHQFQRYTDGLLRGGGIHRMVVTAETLHSDLDSYLEYLLHVLTVKAEKLYARHLGKWVTVLAGSFLWLVGLIVIVAQCRLPPQLFMKVIVLLPILILFGAGVVLVTFHLLHDLCLPRRGYEDTFFFQAVPGARDARLSRVISLTYNPRCLWLLSCHCWQNAPAVCSNPGLSTALARKYGYISRQHRADRWRDQHFPTLRSDQVEKFLFNSEQFLQRNSKENTGCCHRFIWCCLQDSTPPPHNHYHHHHRHHQHHHDNHDPLNTYRQTISDARRKWDPRKRKAQNQVRAADKDSLEASSGYSSDQLRPTFQAKVEDEYMTPNLFVRKLAKESATPEQLLEDEISKIKKKNRAQHPARPVLLDNLHLPSVSPQQRFPAPADLAARGRALSRDDTEVDYGAFYQPHEADPHRLKREYDPLTYGVRLSVRREMAKDMKVWRY